MTPETGLDGSPGACSALSSLPSSPAPSHNQAHHHSSSTQIPGLAVFLSTMDTTLAHGTPDSHFSRHSQTALPGSAVSEPLLAEDTDRHSSQDAVLLPPFRAPESDMGVLTRPSPRNMGNAAQPGQNLPVLAYVFPDFQRLPGFPPVVEAHDLLDYSLHATPASLGPTDYSFSPTAPRSLWTDDDDTESTHQQAFDYYQVQQQDGDHHHQSYGDRHHDHGRHHGHNQYFDYDQQHDYDPYSDYDSYPDHDPHSYDDHSVYDQNLDHDQHQDVGYLPDNDDDYFGYSHGYFLSQQQQQHDQQSHETRLQLGQHYQQKHEHHHEHEKQAEERQEQQQLPSPHHQQHHEQHQQEYYQHHRQEHQQHQQEHRQYQPEHPPHHQESRYHGHQQLINHDSYQDSHQQYHTDQAMNLTDPHPQDSEVFRAATPTSTISPRGPVPFSAPYHHAAAAAPLPPRLLTPSAGEADVHGYYADAYSSQRGPAINFGGIAAMSPAASSMADAGFGKDANKKNAEEPYAKTIYRALMSRPGHAMALREIYDWFLQNTDKGKSKTTGWQNSIRHNLSMNQAFIRTERPDPNRAPGSTSVISEWVLRDWAVVNGIQSTTRYRPKSAPQPPTLASHATKKHPGPAKAAKAAKAGRKGSHAPAKVQKCHKSEQQKKQRMHLSPAIEGHHGGGGGIMAGFNTVPHVPLPSLGSAGSMRLLPSLYSHPSVPGFYGRYTGARAFINPQIQAADDRIHSQSHPQASSSAGTAEGPAVNEMGRMLTPPADYACADAHTPSMPVPVIGNPYPATYEPLRPAHVHVHAPARMYSYHDHARARAQPYSGHNGGRGGEVPDVSRGVAPMAETLGGAAVRVNLERDEPDR